MNAPVQHLLIAEVFCDLCDAPMAEDRDVADATGLNICPLCLEDSINAQAFNARPTVGLVGGGDCWS